MPCGEQTASILRSHGRRVTTQRIAVAEALQHSGGHMTASEVIAAARSVAPPFSARSLRIVRATRSHSRACSRCRVRCRGLSLPASSLGPVAARVAAQAALKAYVAKPPHARIILCVKSSIEELEDLGFSQTLLMRFGTRCLEIPEEVQV